MNWRKSTVKQVYIVQTTDVARRRADWNQGTFKNDEVDAAIISEFLRQGHGRPYHPAEGAYLSLYQLERYRWAREQASTRLKNQIVGHVDRLYPGLVISDQAAAARYQPLFHNLWDHDTPRRLLLLYPQPCDLRQVLDRTLDMIEIQLEDAQVKLTREEAEDLPLLDADPDLLQQMFLNLSLNAIQAMPEGGELHVATAVRRYRTRRSMVDVGPEK